MTFNDNYYTINQIQVNLHKHSEHLKCFPFSQAFSQQTVSTVHGGIETCALVSHENTIKARDFS